MDDADDLEFVHIMEKAESRKKRKMDSHRKNDFQDRDDNDFLRRYRLTKESVMELLTLLDNHLHEPKHPRGLSKMEQLLIALRFYASASFQIIIGDLTDTSQPTVSKVVKRVSQGIAALCKDFIQMPTSKKDLEEVASDFYGIAKFPGVAGCIDCTHIKLQSPGGTDAETFRNRKGYFSLNVQTVSDANLVIRNVIARWPGSVHDSTIFNSSSVKAKFEDGQISEQKYHLLGDSGYALKPYLMTPFLKPTSPAEERYNESHILTRNVIERKYGVLKRRFPCLALGLRCDLENVPPIITACCVLHNLAVKNGDPEPPVSQEIAELLNNDSQQPASQSQNDRNGASAGYAKRKLIVEKFFS